MKNSSFYLGIAGIVVFGISLIVALLALNGSDTGLATAATFVLGAGFALGAIGVVGMALSQRAARREEATRLNNAETRIGEARKKLDALEKGHKKTSKALEQSAKKSKDESAESLKMTEVVLNQFDERLTSVEEGSRTATPSDMGFTADLRAVRMAQLAGTDVALFFDHEQAKQFVAQANSREQFIDTVPVLRAYPDAADSLSLSNLRKLAGGIRRLGYMDVSIDMMKAIVNKTHRESDENFLEVLKTEQQLYSAEYRPKIELPEYHRTDDNRVVLHVVGKALPETQTGYTLRTHYTVLAQQSIGVDPVVVRHVGGGTRQHSNTETYELDGIRYFLLGGGQRNKTPWNIWIEQNIRGLADVVRQVQPQIIHVHSDFLNAVIGQYVGDYYGIPVVNETRGFWEESWLSRTTGALGWKDRTNFDQLYGLPASYELRRNREIEYRSRAAAVVTLAEVMKNHIYELGEQAQLPSVPVSVVPNAVEADNFPVVGKSPEILEKLDFAEDDIVIGYISSIVEYEGIDTLIRAFGRLTEALDKVKKEAAEALELEASDSDDAVEIVDAEDPEAPQLDVRTDELDSEDVVVTEGELAEAQEPLEEEPAEEASEKPRLFSGERELLEAFQNLNSSDAETTDEAWMQNEDIAAAKLENLLSAVPADRELRLLIVGDGKTRAELEELTSELGLEDRVTFTGRVDHSEILSYYGMIDLFVVPRRRSDVTELVTPLKPFEAMSSGRACIFSDVAALREIADLSGAARTFPADDFEALAGVLAELIADPEQIEELSEKAANWVREERTWIINAARYQDVYNSLGMDISLPSSLKKFITLSQKGKKPARLVEQISRVETPEPTGWFILEKKPYTAERIMTQGWGLAKYPPIQFEPGMDWEAPGAENRSWGFHLHAWEFIDPVLQEFYATGDEHLLRWMIDVAHNWWASSKRFAWDESMAWYDMSLSLRMPRLARLMIAIAKSPWRDEVVEFLEMAEAHIDMCLLPEAFNERNNHGFFTAAASLDFTKLLYGFERSQELHDLGVERMKIMADRQFGNDGGHLEHSPDYHRMLLASFQSGLLAGLIEDEATRTRIEKAAYVMGWMVQPDGHLVQFGDSPAFDVDEGGIESVNDQAQFILSNGQEGEPDAEEMIVLPDTGYAFVRSPQPQGEMERIKSSYIAFQAAFHSRAHKHADDLTFTWFDRGHEIIVDSGRYGYVDLLPKDSPDRLKGFYYSAPERQYVESTPAHNTISVNGADIERRARAPYGSALGECVQSDDSFHLSGRADHLFYIHERELEFDPAQRLLVRDALIPTSIDDGVDEAIAWFNIDGSIQIERFEDSLRLRLPDGAGVVRVTTNGEFADLVKGQEEPLRGWRSRIDREFEPTWNFGIKLSKDDNWTLETLFEFE